MDGIKEVFPSHVASVICDRHGLPIASKIEKPELNEELLALSAVSDRKFVDLQDYHMVVRDLSVDTKLMLLLKKSGDNLHRFKRFNTILEESNPM
jgi:hypothetical protein